MTSTTRTTPSTRALHFQIIRLGDIQQVVSVRDDKGPIGAVFVDEGDFSFLAGSGRGEFVVVEGSGGVELGGGVLLEW